MSERWKLKTLGDICDVIGGGTPAKDNSTFYDGDIPWATVRDMKNELLSSTEYHISQEAVKNSATNIIPANNVVIATRVGLGKVCILENDTAINQDLRGILPKNKELSVRYLFRWFQSVAHLIESEGTGATVKGVKLPFIKSLQIPLPSLPEQKRIVAILDEAFAGIETAIANTEQNLANARELFDSYLNKMLCQRNGEWSEARLEEICLEIFAGGDVPIGNFSKEPSEIHSIPIYTNGEKNEGLYGYTELPRVSTPSITISARGTIGYTQIRTQPYYPAIRLIVVVPDHQIIDLTYLYYVVKHMTVGHSGTSIPQLTAPMVRNFQVAYPPLRQQKEIGQDLNSLLIEIHRIESTYQQKLNALAELKQSLLQKAFYGELTEDKADNELQEAVA